MEPMRSLVAFVGCTAVATAARSSPNLVFFLTDDQDQLLGGSFPISPFNKGVTPMPHVQRLMVEEGAMATNFFIHTPICCPSRSETVTGRYLHNVHTPPKEEQCAEGYSGEDDAGNACCMHVDEKLVNNFTMAKYMKDQKGYTSGMFGKYLNVCPNSAQPGWDAWFANGGGNYYNTSFSVENIDGIEDAANHRFNTPYQYNGETAWPYSTALIGNYSIAWIKKVAKESAPWFAYIGYKAAHAPFQPSPWYKDYWSPSWPATAPRPPSWNCSMESRAKHHQNIASQFMLTESAEVCIDAAFKDRWRTLMSVDDAIFDTIAAVDELGQTNDTYFLYSSDHGFQLGELNLPQDKRNVYDFDVRIHLVARGPGIKPGTVWEAPATNVDIAPTLLTLAGVDIPTDTIDGRSFVSFLLPYADEPDVPEYLRPTLRSEIQLRKAGWRESVFVHHYRVGAGSYCGDGHHIDQEDNNFIAVRHLPGSKYGNVLYAEFQWSNGTTYGEGNSDFEEPYWFEMFDLDKDPWQMENIYDEMKAKNPALVKGLREETHNWFACKGTVGVGSCQ